MKTLFFKISVVAIFVVSSAFYHVEPPASELTCAAPSIELLLNGVPVTFVRPSYAYTVKITASSEGVYACLSGTNFTITSAACNDLSNTITYMSILTDANLPCSGITLSAYAACGSLPEISATTTIQKIQKCGL
jgi:hypothetical protein